MKESARTGLIASAGLALLFVATEGVILAVAVLGGLAERWR